MFLTPSSSMARVVTALVALSVVFLCCVNDAINNAHADAVADSLLFGIVFALSFELSLRPLLSASSIFLLSGAMLYAGSSIGAPLCFLPATLCASILAAQVLKTRWRTCLFISCAALACMTICRSFWLHQIPYAFSEPRRGVWEHGQWGNALPHDETLTITSQYSYDLLQRFLGASKLSRPEQLDSVDELWMITPTKPFTPEEIHTIEQWVSRGGRLVLICDHTDLFGHASVCNGLLKPFNLCLRYDVVLDPVEEGGRYYQNFTMYHGLSSNSITGQGESWLVQPGYSERTDYGRPSFFSDNQISDEESAGIFTVGIRKRYGFGGVLIMGDSTLFANFALARPSAQKLLKSILNGGGSVSCNGLAFFASAAWLFANFVSRRKLRMVAVLTCYLVAALCISLAHTSRTINLANLSTLFVTGDSTMVEGNNAPLCTLFSSAYVLSDRFPIWGEVEPESGTVRMGNSSLTRSYFTQPKPGRDAWARLTALDLPDIGKLLLACEQQSGYSSFWFDSGVGIVRETAYRNFWRKYNLTSEVPIRLSATHSRLVPASIKISGQPERHAVIRVTHLSDDPQWVIVGDGFVGKWIDADTILLRSLWQLPDHGLPDTRCKCDDCSPDGS